MQLDSFDNADELSEHQCDEHVDQEKTSIQNCKNQYCPTSTIHRSHRIGQELHQVIDWLHVNRVNHENWIFLTLTILNSDGSGVGGQIDSIMKSWQRFSQRKAFCAVLNGWFRTLRSYTMEMNGRFIRIFMY